MADAVQKDPAGNAAPTGGFKNLGWYSGYQYNNGTWSQTAGQINPTSTQVGAGQQVSSEVNQQSSKLQTPNNPNSVQEYLNSYQKSVNNSIQGADLTGNNTDAVMGAAINANRPAPPNLTQTYQNLSQQYNLTGLNQQMTDLTNKRNSLQTSLETAMNQTEHQAGVTADVVATRENEQERQTQIQMNDVNLQISTLSQQITNANNTIGMIMQFQQQDYQNASQAYDAQVSEAIQYQQLFMQKQQFALDVQKQQFDEQATEQSLSLENKRLGIEAGNQAQSIAMANWQVVANMISTGQIDSNSLTPDQQAHIQSLELQSGLPQGITSQILSNTAAGSRILNVNNSTGQAVLQHPNGRISTMDIPGQSLEPIKLSNGYMYSYDPNSQSYSLIPGQTNIFQNLFSGIFGGGPAQTIRAGQNMDTSTLDNLVEPIK